MKNQHMRSQLEQDLSSKNVMNCTLADCNLWNSTNAVPLIPSSFSCLSHPPPPPPLPAVPAVG